MVFEAPRGSLECSKGRLRRPPERFLRRSGVRRAPEGAFGVLQENIWELWGGHFEALGTLLEVFGGDF